MIKLMETKDKEAILKVATGEGEVLQENSNKKDS